MKTDAMILMYNFKEDERTRQILRYLNIAGISCKTVPVTDYLHPLGYLFGLPGFSPSPQFNLGGNFADEMLVMHNFSQEQQTAFLGFFHRNGLAPVDLKAVLTPVTQHWSSLKLHGELSKEHTLMHKK